MSNTYVETGGQKEMGVGNILESTLKENIELLFSSNREQNKKFLASPWNLLVKQQLPSITEEVKLTK